jgi:hypothetical protein
MNSGLCTKDPRDPLNKTPQSKTRRREPAPCFSPIKKPPPRGWQGSGDGFSQYETTDVPVWPRPKTYIPTRKKPPLG